MFEKLVSLLVFIIWAAGVALFTAAWLFALWSDFWAGRYLWLIIDIMFPLGIMRGVYLFGQYAMRQTTSLEEFMMVAVVLPPL